MNFGGLLKAGAKFLGRLFKSVAKAEAQALLEQAAKKGTRKVEVKIKRRLDL
mgnify:CR=1 FL=1